MCCECKRIAKGGLSASCLFFTPLHIWGGENDVVLESPLPFLIFDGREIFVLNVDIVVG